MSDIRTAKALNSAGSINNLKEEDFLVVKYGTLQNFKVDVFVAADSPLHDGLEALKGDLIPARGAIASAKNLMELQVALQQMRLKVQEIENIAKKDKVHTVSEYLATVAKKVGLYESPEEYREKRERFFKLKEEAKERAHQNDLEIAAQDLKKKEALKKPPLDMLSATAKIMGVLKMISLSPAQKAYEKILADIYSSNKDKPLESYTNKDWLNVGSPLLPDDPMYQLLKGQAVEVIKKFSLQSVGVAPGDAMSAKDFSSYLSQVDGTSTLLANRLGVSEFSVGLGGKVAMWGNSDTGSNAASSRIANDGSSIISMSVGVAPGELLKAWTHSMANYGLNNDLRSGLSNGLSEGLSNGLINPKPEVLEYKTSISTLVKEAVNALDTDDVNKLKRLEAQAETNLKHNFWASALGNGYFTLDAEDRAKLASKETVDAVKSFVKTGDNLALTSILYSSDLVDKPGFENILSKIDSPSPELKRTVEDIKSGYVELDQVKSGKVDLIQGGIAQALIDSKNGFNVEGKVNPVSIELLGKYMENHVFPIKEQGQNLNMVSYKMHTEAVFEQKREYLLGAILGKENLVTPTRELTNGEVDVLLQSNPSKVLSEATKPVSDVNKNVLFELGVSAQEKAETYRSLNSGIQTLSLNEGLIRSRREQALGVEAENKSTIENKSKSLPKPSIYDDY